MKQHPIQLEQLVVRELILDLKNPAPAQAQQENLDAEIRYSMGASNFNPELKSIAVGFICEVNPNDSEASFYIKVHVMGIFSVNVDEFPMDKLEHWSKHNAPILLLPYVRENVYALSARGKINLILPLVTLPTLLKN